MYRPGAVIHRREEVLPKTFERRHSAARDRVFAMTTENVPSSSEAHNMADRFLKHGDSYFRFITTPGIEPTNNLRTPDLAENDLVRISANYRG